MSAEFDRFMMESGMTHPSNEEYYGAKAAWNGCRDLIIKKLFNDQTLRALASSIFDSSHYEVQKANPFHMDLSSLERERWLRMASGAAITFKEKIQDL